MSLSSLTVGTKSITLTPNKYQGYSVHLAGAANSETNVNYAISATAQASGATLTYSMVDASEPSLLTVANIDGWKVSVDGITDGATGTLCIGVTYEGVTNIYEIGIIIDPTET